MPWPAIRSRLHFVFKTRPPPAQLEGYLKKLLLYLLLPITLAGIITAVSLIMVLFEQRLHDRRKRIADWWQRTLQKHPALAGKSKERAAARPTNYTKRRASGLKWREVGSTKPTQREQLRNDELAAALQRKTTFSRAEWNAFNIKGLRAEHCIQAGGSFFEPDDRGVCSTKKLVAYIMPVLLRLVFYSYPFVTCRL